MSARTEQLLERIKLTEQTLETARRDPGAAVIVRQCEADLKVLRRELTSASEALTEGKQILKG